MAFLCNAHLAKIGKRPSRALQCWDTWMGYGAAAMANQCWHTALRYTGSAFDISQALLGKPELVTDKKRLSYVDRFMISGHYLSEIYRKNNSLPQAEEYLLLVHQRLLTIFCDADTYTDKKLALLTNLKMSLQIMRCFYNTYGNFQAYQSICRETQRLIDNASVTNA